MSSRPFQALDLIGKRFLVRLRGSLGCGGTLPAVATEAVAPASGIDPGVPNVLRVLPLLLIALVLARPDGAMAAPSTEAQRLAALRCDGVPGSLKAPVLLIPGTGVDAEQNWSWGYAPALRAAGHGVCTIDPPLRSTVDVQDSVLYVRTAIEEVARRSGRRLTVIGHSQGAFHAVHVLRLFPDLAPLVDDVIGLAGLYERGSDAIRDKCATSCTAPFWQVATGAEYMRALAQRPLPPGPSYTAIGTLADSVVTPQPAVNALTGGRSVQLQDVCPGRRVADGVDHIYLAGDAVGYALATDALDRPGPADPRRIDPSVCLQQLLPGVDAVRLATLGPGLLQALAFDDAVKVDAEPPLRCPLAAGCSTPPAATSVRFLRSTGGARGTLALRVRAQVPGRLRLRFAGSRPATTTSVKVRRGVQTLRLPARSCTVSAKGRRVCRVLSPGLRRVSVELRAAGEKEWRVVRVARLRLHASRRH